eukprot:jgi/Mesvir1/19521/Mv06898-RA.1
MAAAKALAGFFLICLCGASMADSTSDGIADFVSAASKFPDTVAGVNRRHLLQAGNCIPQLLAVASLTNNIANITAEVTMRCENTTFQEFTASNGQTVRCPVSSTGGLCDCIGLVYQLTAFGYSAYYNLTRACGVETMKSLLGANYQTLENSAVLFSTCETKNAASYNNITVECGYSCAALQAAGACGLLVPLVLSVLAAFLA